MSKRHEYQTFLRLKRAAELELRSVMKVLPAEIRDGTTGVQVSFEAGPAKEQIEAGVRPDALCDSRPGGMLQVYLMNVFARYGSEPGAFRCELRRLLVEQLAELAGVDVQWGD